MSDSDARPTRPALRLARDEPDQVPRLAAFRAAHPHVIVGAGEFGVWQALIPRPDGETVVTIEPERPCCMPRYRLPARHRRAPPATCAAESAHPGYARESRLHLLVGPGSTGFQGKPVSTSLDSTG